jgi:hypothetical protein
MVKSFLRKTCKHTIISMFLFLDDSDFKYENNNTRFCQCFGGFLIDPKDVHSVESILDSVKAAHGIPSNLPLKWNFKDKKAEYVAVIGKERYEEILSTEVDQIRESIFEGFAKLNVKIIVSVGEYYQQDRQSQAAEFTYTNLLQRYGMVLREYAKDQLNLIVMDRDHKRSDQFCKIYDEAYRTASGYHSGPLHSASIPYLSFSVSTYNPLLQMADLIVGCTAKFLRHTLEGTEIRPHTLNMFKTLLPKFRKSPSGSIAQWGLVMTNSVERVKVVTAINVLSQMPIVTANPK